MIRLKDIVVDCDCCGKIGKPKIETRSQITFINIIVPLPDGWQPIASRDGTEGVVCPECVEKRHKIREECQARLDAMIRKHTNENV